MRTKQILINEIKYQGKTFCNFNPLARSEQIICLQYNRTKIATSRKGGKKDS